MSSKVLVPLLGPDPDEPVLVVLAQWLATGRIGEAILARVERPSPEVVGDWLVPAELVAAGDAERRRTARRHLEAAAGRLEWNGVPHSLRVLLGDPVEVLARLAEQEQVDLVLTHLEPRRGLGGLLRRSADAFLAAFRVPVLMVGARGLV